MANFSVYHGTFFWEIFGDRLGTGLRKDVNALTLLRILVIGLKFGGMMHITMKHVAIENGYAGPIFAHYTELLIFGG